MSLWSSTNIASAWFYWNERLVCRKREELYHIKTKKITCTAAPRRVRTLKLCWQRSGTSAKHIRAACDYISPERVAFSLRCCPHLPHYSPKLAAAASVPASDLTSAPSNRIKGAKERHKEWASHLSAASFYNWLLVNAYKDSEVMKMRWILAVNPPQCLAKIYKCSSIKGLSKSTNQPASAGSRLIAE